MYIICTCPNGYNLTMTDNVTGSCESKYILIYNLTMTDNVTGICESRYILIYNLTMRTCTVFLSFVGRGTRSCRTV
jgi:hypothetical protein